MKKDVSGTGTWTTCNMVHVIWTNLARIYTDERNSPDVDPCSRGPNSLN